ncbi:MAG: restriction endonuclease [Acidobacteria bacterium]|nr:restriction endonuclease [Acidobacteriota bacterium]
MRGYDFSTKEIGEILNFQIGRSRKLIARERILQFNPTSAKELVQAYLNLYGSANKELLNVVKDIVQEKGFGAEITEDFDDYIAIINRKLELENFENRLTETTSPIPTLNEIDALNGYDFEGFLNELFSRMGYSVEQTRLSGDQGADVVVLKFGEKIVIQAKRFQGNVGNYAVQEIMAAISLYNAQRGMVVTNSYFTKSAKELAVANKIELVDRDALEKLIKDNW